MLPGVPGAGADVDGVWRVRGCCVGPHTGALPSCMLHARALQCLLIVGDLHQVFLLSWCCRQCKLLATWHICARRRR